MKKFANIFIFLFILISLFFLQSCSSADAEQGIEKVSIHSKFIEKAKNATKKFNLTKVKTTCLTFKKLDEKFEGKVMVDVREKHGGICGGDPATSPRLFSIGFVESTGEIWSDAKSLLGQMEKL